MMMMATPCEPPLVTFGSPTHIDDNTDVDDDKDDINVVSASESLTDLTESRVPLRSLSVDDMTTQSNRGGNLTHSASSTHSFSGAHSPNPLSVLNRSFGAQGNDDCVASATYTGLPSPKYANENLSPVSSIAGRGACARVDVRSGSDGNYFAEKTISTLSAAKLASATRELNFAGRYFHVLAAPLKHCGNPLCTNQFASAFNDSTTPETPSALVSKIIATTIYKDAQKRATAPCTACQPTAPGVVQLLAAYTEPSEHTTHIIMEYMDGGDAATAIAGPATDIRVIAAVARQMLEGLRFIHGSMRALHRDIKPENVLVSTTGRVALSDFGCSAVTTHDDDAVQFSDQVGTILYMSPERLLGDVHGVECDVWSLGVTIAALATGKHPFVDTSSIRGSNERMWALAEVLHYTSDSVEEYRAATEAAVAKALLPRDNADLTDFVHCCTWRRSDIASLLEHPFVRGMSLDDAVEHVRKHIRVAASPL